MMQATEHGTRRRRSRPPCDPGPLYSSGSIKSGCVNIKFGCCSPFANFNINITMLDFAPHGNYDGTVLYSTNHAAYPPVAQSPQAQLLPFPAKKSPQSSPQYSPASVHGFDPFAEDSSDETASSSGSDVSRASFELSRQREQQYNVAAWINYASPCAYSPAQLQPQPSPYQQALYTPMTGNTHYHSRTSSSSSASSSRSAFSDDEPYVIYSTPLPGAAPAPAAAAPPAPAHVLGPIAPPRRQHGQAKSLSVPGPIVAPRVASSGVPVHLPHRRYVSLCSIREEDEPRM
ncbi:hypothetical protein PENSPDRAFT_440887 [Peniophora sp. CONT]|nr:hypothetical protein PENSPDRAFT_440887 [Peniophora sp. CONT]